MLPAEARRRLRLVKGERLTVEFREDGVLLRPASLGQTYRMVKHPVSGLSVMVPARRTGKKVTAAEIARLNAELL